MTTEMTLGSDESTSEIEILREERGLPESLSALIRRLVRLNSTRLQATQEATESGTQIRFFLQGNGTLGTFPDRIQVGTVTHRGEKYMYHGLLDVPALDSTVSRVTLCFDRNGIRESQMTYIPKNDLDVPLDDAIMKGLQQAVNSTYAGIALRFLGYATRYMGPVEKYQISVAGYPVGQLHAGEHRSVGSYVGVTWQPRCLARDASKPAGAQDNSRFRVSKEAEKFRVHPAAMSMLAARQNGTLCYSKTGLNPIL